MRRVGPAMPCRALHSVPSAGHLLAVSPGHGRRPQYGGRPHGRQTGGSVGTPDARGPSQPEPGRRFTIEETFRNLKDPGFGFGLSHVRIRDPHRVDRLILLFAIAHALLTLLGAASEATGLDTMLKAKTSNKRQGLNALGWRVYRFGFTWREGP